MFLTFKEYRFSRNTHKEKIKFVLFYLYPLSLIFVDDFYHTESNLNDILYDLLNAYILLTLAKIIFSNRLSSSEEN